MLLIIYFMFIKEFFSKTELLYEINACSLSKILQITYDVLQETGIYLLSKAQNVFFSSNGMMIMVYTLLYRGL